MIDATAPRPVRSPALHRIASSFAPTAEGEKEGVAEAAGVGTVDALQGDDVTLGEADAVLDTGDDRSAAGAPHAANQTHSTSESGIVRLPMPRGRYAAPVVAPSPRGVGQSTGRPMGISRSARHGSRGTHPAPSLYLRTTPFNHRVGFSRMVASVVPDSEERRCGELPFMTATNGLQHLDRRCVSTTPWRT